MAYPCFCGVEDVKLPVVCWPLFMERILEKRCPRCGRGIEPQVYWPKNYYAYFCCSCASAIIQGISFAIRTPSGDLISFKPEDLKPHGKEWHPNARWWTAAELNTTADIVSNQTCIDFPEEPTRRKRNAVPHAP